MGRRAPLTVITWQESDRCLQVSDPISTAPSCFLSSASSLLSLQQSTSHCKQWVNLSPAHRLQHSWMRQPDPELHYAVVPCCKVFWTTGILHEWTQWWESHSSGFCQVVLYCSMAITLQVWVRSMSGTECLTHLWFCLDCSLDMFPCSIITITNHLTRPGVPVASTEPWFKQPSCIFSN